MSNESIRRCLWWLCLLVAPLVLLAIELFHPAGFTRSSACPDCPGMYAYLSVPHPYLPQFKALAYPGPHWWFWLHMIQTPMVALVAIGLWLIAGRADSGPAGALALGWLSRLSTLVFLIYYTALDSIGGFGLGRAILNSQRLAADGKLSPEGLQGAITLLDANWTDPWVGGVGSFISLTGSWAVFVSTVLLALALALARRAPRPALLLLLVFGWELQMSHTNPHGPIAFAALIAAAYWIRRADSSRSPDETSRAAPA